MLPSTQIPPSSTLSLQVPPPHPSLPPSAATKIVCRMRGGVDLFYICTALYSFVQLCSALYSFVQLCTALFSFVQLCSALFSFVQVGEGE